MQAGLTRPAACRAFEGHCVRFRVEGRDEAEFIGVGTHERGAVNVARSAKRVRRKPAESEA